MQFIDPIMKIQLDYYLEKDIRIYDRLEPNYQEMKNSLTTVDSISKYIIATYDKLKDTPKDSLESVAADTTISYKKIIESSSRGIQEAQSLYLQSLDKLRKGFKKDRKVLVFIEDDLKYLKNTLYDLKYKREILEPGLNRFNEKLNQAIFHDDGTAYSRNIRKNSKKLETYKTKMDKYEKFLSNIENIALKEAGGYVYLSSTDKKQMKYMKKYEKGLDQYYSILGDIRKITESI